MKLVSEGDPRLKIKEIRLYYKTCYARCVTCGAFYEATENEKESKSVYMDGLISTAPCEYCGGVNCVQFI